MRRRVFHGSWNPTAAILMREGVHKDNITVKNGLVEREVGFADVTHGND